MPTNCLQEQLISLELNAEFIETTGPNPLTTNKDRRLILTCFIIAGFKYQRISCYTRNSQITFVIILAKMLNLQ
jgi:hypothetical protein